VSLQRKRKLITAAGLVCIVAPIAAALFFLSSSGVHVDEGWQSAAYTIIGLVACSGIGLVPFGFVLLTKSPNPQRPTLPDPPPVIASPSTDSNGETHD